MENQTEKREPICDCGIKTYRYVGYELSLDLCYKCGKFDAISKIENDDFIKFREEHSELIPELIELKYLIPA